MKRSYDDMVSDDHGAAQGGDSGEADDELDKIPPYDAKMEDRPASKIYETRYSKIQDDLEECVTLLEEPFQGSSFSSGSTNGIQEELRRRVKDRSAEKIKIGVVGDMKAGMLA